MQIRKAKREEQLSKRRNVCVLEDGELLGPDQDDIVSSSGMSPGAGVLVPNASSPQQEIVTLDHFRPWANEKVLATGSGSDMGPSIYDVRKMLGFFDPVPPLSAFGTDLQY